VTVKLFPADEVQPSTASGRSEVCEAVMTQDANLHRCHNLLSF
jgi:hypothetical protein